MHDGLRKRTISGDVSDLKGLRTHSGEITRIQLTSTAWVPWQPVSDEWNAGSAMNLCLLSDLAYEYEEVSSRDESGSGSGRLWEDGEADVRAADQPLSYFFASLKGKTDRTQELVSSDIAPGGELPLMTRSMPEGDHFQDLRFWDFNQIGGDRGRLKSVSSYISTVVSFRYVGLLLVSFSLASFVGCASADSSSPAEKAPTLQLVGSKPDSIRMGIRVRYTAQEQVSGCRSLTSSMTTEPISRTSRVFPVQPSDDIFASGSVNVRILPIKYKTRDQEDDLYEWTIPLRWEGELKTCRFEPSRVAFDLYQETGSQMGGVIFKAKSWPRERKPAPTYAPFEGDITIRCSQQPVKARGSTQRWVCDAENRKADGFEIEIGKEDTARVNVNILID